MEIIKNYNNNSYLNQTESKLESQNNTQIEFTKKFKIADYFDYIYSYPPKIKITWNSLDDLKDDFFISSKIKSINYDLPVSDFVEDRGFEATPDEALSSTYNKSHYFNGFLNKINSSNFFLKKTNQLQSALANVPVFVVLNGHKEIVLNKPANVLGSKTPGNYFKEKLYDYCGGFDPIVEKKSELGFFFLNFSDAENYFKELAKSDFEGTNTVSLSIHCISLESAYKITREYHPGVDFRFVPNFKEVRNLLTEDIGNLDMIFEDEQQQVRVRHREVNSMPFLNKLGNYSAPYFSLLQHSEYFKGVPIYIVQLSDKPGNLVAEQYFKFAGLIDNVFGGCLYYLNHITGFGHNRIIEGSVKEQISKNSDKSLNYIFFEKRQATEFYKQNGRKIHRYTGSNIGKLGQMVRKPKILVYNLEDFLEDWEDHIQEKLTSDQNMVQTIFKNEKNHFITPTIDFSEIETFSKPIKPNLFKNVSHNLNVKYRVFKRAVGVFFSL